MLTVVSTSGKKKRYGIARWEDRRRASTVAAPRLNILKAVKQLRVVAAEGADRCPTRRVKHQRLDFSEVRSCATSFRTLIYRNHLSKNAGCKIWCSLQVSNTPHCSDACKAYSAPGQVTLAFQNSLSGPVHHPRFKNSETLAGQGRTQVVGGNCREETNCYRNGWKSLWQPTSQHAAYSKV
jgi:hypothetical protein